MTHEPQVPAGTRNASATPGDAAWQRLTEGETRVAASVAVLVMIGLQLLLPPELTLIDRRVVPAVELVLLVTLVIANPRRIVKTSRPLRWLGLLLISIASAANAWAILQLIQALLQPDWPLGNLQNEDAAFLLKTGANIWLTNVIVFGLWFWELDRGGPAARAQGTDPDPDFLFPQMATQLPSHAEWEPDFVDYFYVSFTNSTAFSPTDAMPLSRWAKSSMTVQAAVSLSTAVVVIARAVNVFP